MRRHPRLARLTALFVACVLVGVTAFVAGDGIGPSGSTGSSLPGASPDAPAGAAGSSAPSAAPGTPAPTEGPWADLALPPIEPVATLVAADVERTGIGRSSRFTLTSLSDVPATTLAKGVEALPKVDFAVKKGSNSRTAVLVPRAPLAAGVSYRVTLRTPDGALGGSWLFRAESPLRVASTLPGDQATEVPVDTGIEVTFDQDGVGPIAPFFSIAPKVAGAFEAHARTWAFVPAAPLEPATIYTVTVRRGVTLSGSDQVLEDDVRFSFETVGQEKVVESDRPPLDASFERSILEVVPADPPLVGMYVEQPWEEDDTRKPLTLVGFRVYRLPDLPAAMEAYRILSAAPDWARSSDDRLVATQGLPLVTWFTARIHTIGGTRWDATSYVEFPAPLDRGWYLVVRPRALRDQQMLLQVTDVATYVTTTTTRSAVWVNDVTSGEPIAGARLWTAAGKAIATTGPDGTATPTIPDGDLFVVTAPDAGPPGGATLAGRAAILPLHVGAADDTWGCGPYGSDDDFWHILATDRRLYRPTDEVDAWGMVRLRDGGSVPADAELRVSTSRWDCDETPAENAALAIARVPLTLGGRTGTFAAPVPIHDLPTGSYQVELWAGATRVSSREIEVGEIRKPSYTIGITTDRHVLVEGDAFTAIAASAFFDGTPVPGLPLRLDGTDLGSDPYSYGTVDGGLRTTTSTEGAATVKLVATWPEGWGRGHDDWREISVAAVTAEEADTPNESAGYVVFPSRLLLDGEAEVEGATLRVTGEAHVLDQEGAEREWVASAGTDWDAEGAPAAGARIRVDVVDNWYVQVPTGRGYDFITKRAFDTYRYDRKERALPDTDVVAGPDGTFALDVSRAMGGVAAPRGHWYDVTLSGRDAGGRAVSASAYAYSWWNDFVSDPSSDEAGVPTLGFGEWPESDPQGSDSSRSNAFAVGAEMRLPLTWRGGQPPTGGSNRFLFLTATRGLRDLIVTSSPVFVHRFAQHDLPNASVEAVWFTGQRYVVGWGAEAEFDRADRELSVTLTPDANRHAPGDAARLSVRTTDGDGRPVAATVVLRAIDEKLYAINGAFEESPLEDLYAGVSSGIETTYASHPTPTGRGMSGQGDTTGGGGGLGPVRHEFRDSVLFERITTDASGRASVTFELSDDITSWRVSGAAMTADFRVGQAAISMPVGLPFFIEAPLAPEYLVSDRPTLLLRAYGTALSSATRVTFTASAPTLGMAATTVRASAFTPVAVALPALKPGDHAITIRASAASASGTVRDALVRTIRVVESRFTQTRSAYAVLPAALPKAGGDGMATYVFADAGRGKYLWPVRELARGGGDRVDQALAALVARDVLKDSFGLDEAASSGYPYALDRYQKEPVTTVEDMNRGAGIALLPYGSPEVALSARVSLLAAERFNGWALGDYFRLIRADPAATREMKNLALAGLAGLAARTGSDYVSEPAATLVVAALADPSLTVRERLYLALAAATLGDHATALATERDLLEAYGQRLGPWVRLDVGSTENDILEATSLLALIAVTVGDPLSDAAEAYVEEHFTSEDLYDLQKAAFLRAAVDRAPAPPARFSYTLAGKTRVVDLGRGETYELRLTPSQRATLSAKVLRGRVGVTVGWEEPVAPSSVALDASVSLTRTITPASPVPAGSVVTVTLTPTFGELTISGCYRVVELAPSGLLPLTWAWGGTHGSEDVTPWVISGQKVVFCTGPWWSRQPRLVYYARVVTPGTYAWEPAVMQASRAAESAALTAPATIVLR